MKKFEATTSAIVSGLREVHDKAMANYDQTLKRGQQITTVATKKIDFHSRAGQIKKSAENLRRGVT
jgi:hypothetical protein